MLLDQGRASWWPLLASGNPFSPRSVRVGLGEHHAGPPPRSRRARRVDSRELRPALGEFPRRGWLTGRERRLHPASLYHREDLQIEPTTFRGCSRWPSRPMRPSARTTASSEHRMPPTALPEPALSGAVAGGALGGLKFCVVVMSLTCVLGRVCVRVGHGVGGSRCVGGRLRRGGRRGERGPILR